MIHPDFICVISFDAYMMHQALENGCHLNLAEVVDFERSNTVFKVITSKNTVEADVIVGATEFRKFYLPVFRQITEDLWYARTARRLTNLPANYGGMDTVLALAEQSQTLRRALTEAVAGACTYKTILHRLTQERILWRGGASLLRLLLK